MMAVMEERRHSTRYPVWFPMSVDSGSCEDGLAVSQNISTAGVLMATAVTLEEGAPATVSFQLTPKDSERAIRGRIVRVCVNDRDPDGLWPRLIAIEFKEPVPELESLLDDLAEKPPV
jgi:hypothetical protein